MNPLGIPATHWPPLPPEPPEPKPPRSPWLPEARPASPASASAAVVIGESDWLAQRLLDQRVVALSGEVDVLFVVQVDMLFNLDDLALGFAARARCFEAFPLAGVSLTELGEG